MFSEHEYYCESVVESVGPYAIVRTNYRQPIPEYIRWLRGVPYLFLEIATITIPSTAIAIAGATVSPVAPDKKSHTANAMQMSPTISLSFLT